MTYKLVSQPSSEDHAENIIHHFVRDQSGTPNSRARIKLWAGLPPHGTPAYWNDDVPFRYPNGAGMLEFITLAGPMPEDRDYWAQIVDENASPQGDLAISFCPRSIDLARGNSARTRFAECWNRHVDWDTTHQHNAYGCAMG